MRFARTAVLLVALSGLAGLVACRDKAPKPSPTPAAPSGRSWATLPPETADGGVAARRLPRVVYQGGPFLRNPRIVTVTFKGEDAGLVARLERFGAEITRSAWWREVVDDYCAKPDDCVGEGSAAAPAHLDEALPKAVNELAVDEMLARRAKAGELGPLEPQTLLLVYLPRETTLTGADVAYCAGGPRAYHRVLEVDEKRRVAYAVVPRCKDESELTATASHELLEATTNPSPSARGFAFTGSSDNLGFVISGVEPVDPCGVITMDGHRTEAAGFVVQRAWSNRAASLGHDPCVPAPADRPYLALVPRQGTVRLPKPGESVTIVLDAFADRTLKTADATWNVSAFDLTGRQRHETYVDVGLDKTTVAAGDTVELTITLRKQTDDARGVVAVVSKAGETTHMWPVAVSMR